MRWSARSGLEVPRGGPYALQAAIAACHARALRAEDTDWTRIAGLYALLARAMPSQVELNRAVAVGKAFGAEAGLAIAEYLARCAAAARLCAVACGARGSAAATRAER